jgi:hypothetical protein
MNEASSLVSIQDRLGAKDKTILTDRHDGSLSRYAVGICTWRFDLLHTKRGFLDFTHLLLTVVVPTAVVRLLGESFIFRPELFWIFERLSICA